MFYFLSALPNRRASIIRRVMAATPDLPPGARTRMWLLFTATVIAGGGMYAIFGRMEGLWLAGGVLAILLYLLVGVELTLREDQRSLGPLVDRTVKSLSEEFWIIADGQTGAILHLTDAGYQALGHSDILLGQRLTDLTEELQPQAHVECAEMLRFGSVGKPWRGGLQLKDELGRARTHRSRLLPVELDEARRYGLVAIGPDSDT